MARILLVFLGAGLLAGCGGGDKDGGGSRTEVSTATGAAQSAPAADTDTAQQAPEEDPSDAVHALGEEINLQATVSATDNTTGETTGQDVDLAIRVSQLVDPARNPYVPASSAEPGTRWVRVLVHMKNSSSDTYRIAGGQFTLVDDGGGDASENFSSAPWHSLGNGKLLSGDTRRGWLGFLVKKGSKPDELRWEPFIGGDSVYRWDLTQ